VQIIKQAKISRRRGGEAVKGVGANVTRGLQTGSKLVCIDNSGAREVKIISVIGYKGTRRRYPKAGIGDMIIVSVRKGKPELRKQLFEAIVVRQRRPYRRPDGAMVSFEDNAVVLTNRNGDVRGSGIKGPIAREAADRWPRIAAIASMVV